MRRNQHARARTSHPHKVCFTKDISKISHNSTTESPDMTITSGHGAAQQPTNAIRRSTSIRSMFATSLGNSQVAEVRCDTLHTVASGGLCRINNSKDHHFPPLHCEEVVGRAVSELGRQVRKLNVKKCAKYKAFLFSNITSSSPTASTSPRGVVMAARARIRCALARNPFM